MSLRPFIALAAVLLFLPACGKPTAAELATQEQAKLREQKRLVAIEVYSDLIKNFPDSPRAKEAEAELAALKAAAPKK